MVIVFQITWKVTVLFKRQMFLDAEIFKWELYSVPIIKKRYAACSLYFDFMYRRLFLQQNFKYCDVFEVCGLFNYTDVI